jgi:hypothetical protein
MSDDPAGEMMQYAASGDREALRLIATACVASQFIDVPAFEAMVGAEAFARLMACHNVPDDQFLLAGILYTRALHIQQTTDDTVRMERLCDEVADIIVSTPMEQGQGLEFLAGVLSASADDGDDLASVMEANLMQRAGPSLANKLRNAINGSEKAASALFAVESLGR